jgi:hypothetical protein
MRINKHITYKELKHPKTNTKLLRQTQTETIKIRNKEKYREKIEKQ